MIVAVIPIGAVRFSSAFERWAAAIRPTDAELLARRESSLSDAAEAARAAGDLDRATGLSETLHHLRVGDDRQRAAHAGMFWLSEMAEMQRAFFGALRRGNLAGRVLIGNIERAIVPDRWREITFAAAQRHQPEIYFDAGEFGAWLAVATRPAAASFAELVAFLADRLPPAPALSPAEADDFVAVQGRFGDQFKREVIRQARHQAYRDRKRGRGKSAA